MGKWMDGIKEKYERHILIQSDKVDIPSNTSALSTVSPPISHIVKKKSCIDVCKIMELKHLIKKISARYGGDDEQFLEDYINDAINEWSNDLDAALTCF